MRFSLTEEQEMLRESVRGALARELPLDRVRACLESGDMSAVATLAGAQGWTGIGIPEAAGGQGGGVVEQTILAEELGYAAAPSSSLLGGALAARVLVSGGDAPAVLGQLADGALGVVLALDAAAGDAGAVRVAAQWATGDVANVLGAPEADGAVIVDGPRAFLARLGGEDGEVRPRGLVDPGRTIGDLRFDDADVEPLGAAGTLADAAALGAVLTAAEAVGAAARLLELTVEYIGQRVQFGVVIGTFQAVKHTTADMLVDVETARSAVRYAAWALGAGGPGAQAGVNMAKSYAVPAAVAVADRALALHGAVGFTWEHDLHLFLKRIHTAGALFGGAGAHREQLATSLDLTGTAGAIPAAAA